MIEKHIVKFGIVPISKTPILEMQEIINTVEAEFEMHPVYILIMLELS